MLCSLSERFCPEICMTHQNSLPIARCRYPYVGLSQVSLTFPQTPHLGHYVILVDRALYE